MKLVSIEAFLIDLPFRFAFKHNLASRKNSQNLIVRTVIADGARLYEGYGEGVPRDYVTGETPENALSAVQNEFAPRFAGETFKNNADLIASLKAEWKALFLDSRPRGASWCAFELSILDAAAKVSNQGLARFLQGDKASAGEVRYGGVVPFGGNKALNAVLMFYKFFGFKTVKLKVGADLEQDLHALKKAREILGEQVILRVDANCGWSATESIAAAEQMRKFRVASYEQPVPADDLEGLAAVTAAIPEKVLADESLCTVVGAQNLAETKSCSAFNIRISKVGGLLAARAVAEIARSAGLECHMGAQVGESGILSAAGRVYASMFPNFANYEGSNNLFLLQEDITAENLNVGWGGRACTLPGTGLGITVMPERLSKYAVWASNAVAFLPDHMRPLSVQ